MSYVLAFDSGTTGIRAILFDKAGAIVSDVCQELTQIYPEAGWVEHDPGEIWRTQLTVARQALAQAGTEDVAAIGITNQRETTILWDRATGAPIMNAIVWQDRRTAAFCDELKERGLEGYVRETTGLVIDPYFSGTKIRWMLDNVPGARERAEAGELAFGTVDSWLIWNLTGGRVHVTDYTNASRTMLFDIHRLDWDSKLLPEVGVPRALLPEVRPSSAVYGETAKESLLPAGIPVAAACGDQHGALFGQACFEPGMVKATFGTGASLLINTGTEPVDARSGMLAVPAWGVNGSITYALEGLIFVAAAAVQWLRDGLELIHDAAETEACALRVPDTNGVYMVPAFVGLAAPYWDPYARGALMGLTRGVTRDHVVRATLESTAYQIKDALTLMEEIAGREISEIRADGGAARNNFLLQFQADILGVPVVRPKIIESSARGAAFLAGLAIGFWHDYSELADTFELDRRFEPSMDGDRVDALYAGWRRAVDRTRDWVLH
ncbi:MAG TPA: glycerol kinase GlpK [Solirubrobacter sp.]|nr:glycerol kinase GlpK [Solirubrobacter sp.]